jgi:hypothetical protein
MVINDTRIYMPSGTFQIDEEFLNNNVELNNLFKQDAPTEIMKSAKGLNKIFYDHYVYEDKSIGAQPTGFRIISCILVAAILNKPSHLNHLLTVFQERFEEEEEEINKRAFSTHFGVFNQFIQSVKTESPYLATVDVATTHRSWESFCYIQVNQADSNSNIRMFPPAEEENVINFTAGATHNNKF